MVSLFLGGLRAAFYRRKHLAKKAVYSALIGTAMATAVGDLRNLQVVHVFPTEIIIHGLAGALN